MNNAEMSEIDQFKAKVAAIESIVSQLRDFLMPPAYGYQRSPSGDLIEHEGEQAILALVKQYIEKGLTMQQVANVLAQMGIRSRHSGLKFDNSDIEAIYGRQP
jgi:hypothetical protein